MIASNKATDLKKWQGRAKRGGGRVLGEGEMAGGDDGGPAALELIAGNEPTPEFACELAEEYQQRLDQLGDESLRRVAQLRLEGYDYDEIAGRLGVARRTVARKLEMIRDAWAGPSGRAAGMSGPPASGESSAGPARLRAGLARRRIDAACDGFESHWRGGRRPAIEDYLAEVLELKCPTLLRELLALELESAPGNGRGTRAGGIPESVPGAGRGDRLGLRQARSTQGPRNGLRARLAGSASSGDTPEGVWAKCLWPATGNLTARSALKQILDRHADDPVSRNRFLLEAEITGSLEHPGIVPVHGMGLDERGRPYYAMRFIRGENLQETIRGFHAEGTLRSPGERALALQKLLRRFLDVCNAIGYAHSRGVLHRDIKPSNIVVGDHGETLVVDWGLAKTFGTAKVAPAFAAPRRTPPRSAAAPSPPRLGPGYPGLHEPRAGGRRHRRRPAVRCLQPRRNPVLPAHRQAAVRGGRCCAVLRQVQAGEFPPPRATAGQSTGPWRRFASRRWRPGPTTDTVRLRNLHRTSSAGSRTSRCWPIANPGRSGWVAGDGGTSRWFSRWPPS